MNLKILCHNIANNPKDFPANKLKQAFEDYHQHRLEKDMPSDEEIENEFPKYGTKGTVLLDYNLTRRQGAKWLKQHLLKSKTIPVVVGQSEQLCQHERSVTNRICDVCGSDDIIEAPSMGKNCNSCNPL